jgi:tetratricopeptide (TPR) repeat protein
MLDKKILEKFIHFSVAKDVESEMDLNEAAEFLDHLDDEIKSKIFVKDQQEKENQSMGGIDWILSKTKPIYRYGFASAFALVLAVLMFKQKPNPSFTLSPGFNSNQLSQQAITLLKETHGQSNENLPYQNLVDRVLNRLVHAANMANESVSAEVISTGEPGAWVLPDHQIVVSSEIVSLCASEDELAVILAHELAHVKKGHVTNPFINKNLNIQYRGYLDQLEMPVSDHLIQDYTQWFHHNVNTTDHELLADREGITLTVLAGYDPNAVYSIFEKVLLSQSSNNYPSKETRMDLMKTRFGEVIDDSELFYGGLAYYIKGDLNQAENLFKAYEHKFPGREVYNNLGVIQYHRALYRMPHSEIDGIRAIGMDFHTLADKMTLRGNSTNYSINLNRAKTYFEKAVSLDQEYALGHFNLANINLDLDDIVAAELHLSLAKSFGFNSDKCKHVQSSLLIAQNRNDEANLMLRSLPESPEVWFNQGVIAKSMGESAGNYFEKFIQSEVNSHPVFQEYAESFVNHRVLIEDKLPECELFENVSIGNSKNKAKLEFGFPQNRRTLIPGLTLWNYSEKSLKIYFEEDQVAMLIHTNPLDCEREILTELLHDRSLQLNPKLRNYRSFDSGFIAGDDLGLSLYGKYK